MARELMNHAMMISTVFQPDQDQAGQALAASITRTASKQTYYIVRFLVDRDRIPDAYQAYAYFRWVDDYLDREGITGSEGITFIKLAREWFTCLRL